MSRFVEQKNLPRLLEAFARYLHASAGGGWHLVLLGDGPSRDQLVAQCEALHVRSKVHFPGFKQYAELPAYFGLASAFVQASQREPWGLVVNEAMAAGVPVLVSERCGCAHDLVAVGENGFLFDPANVEELTAVLTKVAACEPPVLAALGEAGRRRIAGWSPQNFAHQLERAVDSALSGPIPRADWPDRLLLRLLIRKANVTASRLLPSRPKDSQA